MHPTNSHPDPANGSACTSPAEVRDFLQQMKAKNAEEVLGTAANRGLVVAMVQATVITVVLLVGFTFGPPVWGKIFAGAKPEAAAPVEKNVTTETPEPAKKSPAPADTKVENPTPNKTPPPPEKDFLKKIGATDTKKASPKVNPLDKTTDDLFKDIDKKP